MHLTLQHNIARLLYWGSKGIKRNIKRALEFYRRGADADDPVAQFDYGIVLLKVIESLIQLTNASLTFVR